LGRVIAYTGVPVEVWLKGSMIAATMDVITEW
jgi:hypothetical protein